MTTLERQQRHYTAEDIEEGLVALAFHRSSRKAADATGIPYTTLDNWKRIHADRLEQIKADLSETMAQSHDSIVHRLTQQTHRTLDVYAKKVDDLKAADAASAIRNLSVAQGVHEDKALTHRGQPTVITEHQTADVTISRLKRMGIVIDGEATELPSEPVPLPASGAEPTSQRASSKAERPEPEPKAGSSPS